MDRQFRVPHAFSDVSPGRQEHRSVLNISGILFLYQIYTIVKNTICWPMYEVMLINLTNDYIGKINPSFIRRLTYGT